MNNFPKELKYSASHEWVRQESDGSMVVGITEHAQSQLGELVFVELPENHPEVHASDEVCVVESVKAASDVFSPISGKIVDVNEDLEDAPGLINSDPYGDGWLYKIDPKDMAEFNELMSADAYQSMIEEE